MPWQNNEAQEWKPVPGHIMTPWAEDVTPDNAWQEYPRPQMVRKEWKNLNGLWDFAINLGTNRPPLQVYSRKILVPFCVESALSGIKEFVRGTQEMMYRRSFSVPENWKGQRIMLNFQAVDYYAKVWVNGKFVGEHKGGYDSFRFDITDALSSDDNQVVNLVVWDPTNQGTQPVGKQVLPENARGYRYTPTSGIWQTVWLEPVPVVSIANLKILPDIDEQTLTVNALLKGWNDNHQIKVQAFDNGKEVATGSGDAGKPVSLDIRNPKLWSPDSPFLYDLKVTLLSGDKPVDVVDSYFGMRKISLGRDASGHMRVHLNNKEIFQLGPLDQGYWPDGILIPATDEALKYDVQYLKDIGCNMIRVHIKVHPERWYYYCDKIGLVVWQDMISPHTVYSRSEIGGASAFEAEWERIIDQLYNYPSIIQWTVFNEAWVQYDTERLTEWTKRKDPSRIVSNASGWTDRNVGDIRDYHDYTMYPSVGYVPDLYPRAQVIGEGGGFDLPLKGHLWYPDQTMPEKINRAGDVNRETVLTPEVLDERYSVWVENLWYLKNYGLDAIVYTQVSDVEIELNGWLTYDRKVSKIPVKRLAEIHSKLFQPVPKGNFLVPLSMDKSQNWMYSLTEPSAGWFKKGQGKWSSGSGPFGIDRMDVPRTNTRWNAGSLYLKKDFNLADPSGNLTIVTYNSGVADVYINGEMAIQINNLMRTDAELKVSEVPLPPAARKLLKKGTNTIAVKFEFPPNAAQKFYYFDLGLKQY